MLQIYEFQNKHNNYMKGSFYFIEESDYDAIGAADLWAWRHNKQVNQNSNYIVNFDHDKMRIHKIKKGYLSLNRE
jgi:hypothetical protein